MNTDENTDSLQGHGKAKGNKQRQNDDLNRLNIRFHSNPLLNALIRYVMDVREINRRLGNYHQIICEAISEGKEKGQEVSQFLQLVLDGLETDWELNDPAGVMVQMAHLKSEGESEGQAKPERPMLVVTNHPLGGRDGVALMSCMSQLYGDKGFKVLVNEFLLSLSYLREVFLPIRPLQMKGGQRMQQLRHLSQELGSSLSGQKALLFFPAGMCSRWHLESLSLQTEWQEAFGSQRLPAAIARLSQAWRPLQQVYDLPWQHSFLRLARKHQLPVLPLHISGQNSALFYRLCKLRKRLGLRFNWEMLLLPREFLYNRHAATRQAKCHLRISPGAILPPAALANWPTKGDHFWAQLCKHYVHQLPFWLESEGNPAQQNMDCMHEAVLELAALPNMS